MSISTIFHMLDEAMKKNIYESTFEIMQVTKQY